MTLTSAAMLPLLALAAHGAETTFFAFDDHNIAWQHNLKLTLAAAEKHPANPVLRAGPPGSPDHGHAILYGTVLKQDGIFKMWYLGMRYRGFLRLSPLYLTQRALLRTENTNSARECGCKAYCLTRRSSRRRRCRASST